MFQINQTVTVPTTVHPSGKAVIVGMEWGPSRGVKAKDGWLYYLTFGSGPAWEATEGQLKEWNQ